MPAARIFYMLPTTLTSPCCFSSLYSVDSLLPVVRPACVQCLLQVSPSLPKTWWYFCQDGLDKDKIDTLYSTVWHACLQSHIPFCFERTKWEKEKYLPFSTILMLYQKQMQTYLIFMQMHCAHLFAHANTCIPVPAHALHYLPMDKRSLATSALSHTPSTSSVISIHTHSSVYHHSPRHSLYSLSSSAWFGDVGSNMYVFSAIQRIVLWFAVPFNHMPVWHGRCSMVGSYSFFCSSIWLPGRFLPD